MAQIKTKKDEESPLALGEQEEDEKSSDSMPEGVA